MDIRYEGKNGELDLQVVESLQSSSDRSPKLGKLSTLIDWHNADPVDSFEIRRNNTIYSFQKNRNPFIDHPELVDYIYGSKTTSSWNPTVSVIEKSNNSLITIYPNPNSEKVIIKGDYNSFRILSKTGEIVKSGKQVIELDTSDLKVGIYIIEMITKNNKIVSKRLIIN